MSHEFKIGREPFEIISHWLKKSTRCPSYFDHEKKRKIIYPESDFYPFFTQFGFGSEKEIPEDFVYRKNFKIFKKFVFKKKFGKKVGKDFLF